jgi:hypothetical protein
MVGIGHDGRRPAVVEDVGDLVPMESSVDGHRDQAGMPNGDQGLEVLRPVAHQDGDPVPGRQAELISQATRGARRPGGELGPAGMEAFAVRQSRCVRQAAGVTFDPHRQVHGSVLPSEANAGNC